jgi:hypothetical protein
MYDNNIICKLRLPKIGNINYFYNLMQGSIL